MAPKYDPTDPQTRALFRLNNAQLAQRHGIRGEDLDALRKAQWDSEPATSADDLLEARRVVAKPAAKAEKKAD